MVLPAGQREDVIAAACTASRFEGKLTVATILRPGLEDHAYASGVVIKTNVGDRYVAGDGTAPLGPRKNSIERLCK